MDKRDVQAKRSLIQATESIRNKFNQVRSTNLENKRLLEEQYKPITKRLGKLIDLAPAASTSQPRNAMAPTIQTMPPPAPPSPSIRSTSMHPPPTPPRSRTSSLLSRYLPYTSRRESADTTFSPMMSMDFENFSSAGNPPRAFTSPLSFEQEMDIDPARKKRDASDYDDESYRKSSRKSSTSMKDEKIRQKVAQARQQAIIHVRESRELERKTPTYDAPSTSTSHVQHTQPILDMVESSAHHSSQEKTHSRKQKSSAAGHGEDDDDDGVEAEIEKSVKKSSKSGKKTRPNTSKYVLPLESRRQEAISKRAEERGIELSEQARDFFHDVTQRRDAEAKKAARSGPNIYLAKAKLDADTLLKPIATASSSTTTTTTATDNDEKSGKKKKPKSHRMMTRSTSTEQELSRPFRSRSPLRKPTSQQSLNERVARTMTSSDDRARALRLNRSKSHTGKGLIDLSMKQFKVNNQIASSSYTFWNDPNELVERLRLIVASTSAGHTGHHNEITSIIEELREAKVIQ